jgi:hypothetical protein
VQLAAKQCARISASDANLLAARNLVSGFYEHLSDIRVDRTDLVPEMIQVEHVLDRDYLPPLLAGVDDKSGSAVGDGSNFELLCAVAFPVFTRVHP